MKNEKTTIINIKLNDAALLEIDLSNGKHFFITTDVFFYAIGEYFKKHMVVDAKTNERFYLESVL